MFNTGMLGGVPHIHVFNLSPKFFVQFLCGHKLFTKCKATDFFFSLSPLKLRETNHIYKVIAAKLSKSRYQMRFNLLQDSVLNIDNSALNLGKRVLINS